MMDRCNELCTKDATGTCALCEALAERDRFIRFWFKGGLLLDGVQTLRRGRIFAYLRRYGWLIVRLRNQSKAPRCRLYPVPLVEVRHKDVVREAHKQYSETLNKTMLTLLGVALFCVLTTLGSPDKLLLTDRTIKVPLADTQISFGGFIVVSPGLLIVLVTYLHIFYRYWLECERDRLYINQRLIPPIESIPTLFSFPDVISRLLTQGIFYWLVPLVLVVTRIGLLLTYVSGIVTIGLVVLLFRRRHDNQRKSWAPLRDTILFLIIGLMVGATVTPQWFQRPFDLFRAELPKAWLVGINMSRARADFANLEGANLEGANLEGANLEGANLEGAHLQQANLKGANLEGADLVEANLEGANLQGANFRETIGLARWQLSGAHNATLAFYSPVLLTALKLPPDHNEKLKDKNLAQYDLSQANLQGAKLGKADLQQANLQGANLNRATLVGANLSGATLVGARFLSQDQVDGACVDEHTKLSAGLRKPPQCPAR